jgi:hypothetical protein
MREDVLDQVVDLSRARARQTDFSIYEGISNNNTNPYNLDTSSLPPSSPYKNL